MADLRIMSLKCYYNILQVMYDMVGEISDSNQYDINIKSWFEINELNTTNDIIDTKPDIILKIKIDVILLIYINYKDYDINDHNKFVRMKMDLQDCNQAYTFEFVKFSMCSEISQFRDMMFQFEELDMKINKNLKQKDMLIIKKYMELLKRDKQNITDIEELFKDMMTGDTVNKTFKALELLILARKIKNKIYGDEKKHISHVATTKQGMNSKSDNSSYINKSNIDKIITFEENTFTGSEDVKRDTELDKMDDITVTIQEITDLIPDNEIICNFMAKILNNYFLKKHEIEFNIKDDNIIESITKIIQSRQEIPNVVNQEEKCLVGSNKNRVMGESYKLKYDDMLRNAKCLILSVVHSDMNEYITRKIENKIKKNRHLDDTIINLIDDVYVVIDDMNTTGNHVGNMLIKMLRDQITRSGLLSDLIWNDESIKALLYEIDNRTESESMRCCDLASSEYVIKVAALTNQFDKIVRGCKMTGRRHMLEMVSIKVDKFFDDSETYF